jgi:hypothetical protein
VTHLSAEQIAQWISGERTAEAELHAGDCERCRAVVAGFEDVLAQFRSSALSVSAPLPTLRAQRRVVWPRWVAVSAAAALLVLVPVYRDRQARERAASDREDALLLQQVDAEISRAVPGSMDPLVKMVSWNSGSTERSQNEGQK